MLHIPCRTVRHCNYSFKKLHKSYLQKGWGNKAKKKWNATGWLQYHQSHQLKQLKESRQCQSSVEQTIYSSSVWWNRPSCPILCVIKEVTYKGNPLGALGLCLQQQTYSFTKHHFQFHIIGTVLQCTQVEYFCLTLSVLFMTWWPT